MRVTFFESLRPLVVSSPSPEPSADLVEPAPLHAAAPLALTMAATATAAADHAAAYARQESTDSGWDNPFRPDGDLSREADEIVELIKGGKPITPTPGSTAPQLPEPASAAAGDGKAADGAQSPQLQPQQQLQAGSPQLAAKQASPPLQQQVANSKPAAAAGANGNAPGAAAANAAPDAKPAAVEVQRGTVVQPSDASQVEHVVIKKKPKCKCCVIQ